MNQETLTKFHVAQRMAASLDARLMNLSDRLAGVGMDSLAKELQDLADDANHVSGLVDKATGEAVSAYFNQSVESTHNMVRGIVAALSIKEKETA